MTPQTLADLRARCRLLLASTAAWPDATLDGFIQDAIRFYSAEFPRLWRHSLSLVTGTPAYDLPGHFGLVEVASVEYPAGQTPPAFLVQVEEWDPDFQAGDAVYALRGIDDSTAPGDEEAVGQIVLAPAVATGETAVISYWGVHPVPAVGSDTDVITIPLPHWEALLAFVDFRCHWELEADEAVNATTTSVVLSQLGENGRRAWNRYREVMDRLQWLAASRSAVIDWSGIGVGG